MKRIGVVGSGRMALRRGKALLDTGKAEIVAVSSRNIEHAKRAAQKLGAERYFDDYHKMAKLELDALLIEVPHAAQMEMIRWGVKVVSGILVGAALAVNLKEACEIERLAEKNNCLIEAGYNARYDALWEKVKEIIWGGFLGRPVMAQSIALYLASPSSWYYKEGESGGMPLTHMTYCFINPVRWILGRVIEVSASANQLLHKGDDFVKEEMCAAILRFQNDCIYSMVAGYIAPPGFPGWEVKFVCTNGGLEISGLEKFLKVYRDGEVEVMDFSSRPSSLLRQAEAFLDALDGKAECLNPPSDAKIDVAIAEAIRKAARNHTVIRLEQPSQ